MKKFSRVGLLITSCISFSAHAQTEAMAFPDGSETDVFPVGFQEIDLYLSIFDAPTLSELTNPAPLYTADTRYGYMILAYQGEQYDPLELGRRGWWRDRSDDGYEMSQSGVPLTSTVIPAPSSSIFGSTIENGIVDSVDMLIALLEQGYDRGFRRFMINRPAGFDRLLPASLGGKGDLPNASWWSLDSELRDSLSDVSDNAVGGGGLAWWIAKKNEIPGDPVTVGVYIGFQFGDAWSTLHSGDHLDADKLSHVWAMYRNIIPWKNIGVTEFVFDHVGGITQNSGDPEARSDSFYRLRNHPAFAGLHIIGEHPVMTKLLYGNGQPLPSGDLDESRVVNNPWVLDALRLNTHSVDAGKVWDITGINGEVNVWYDHHPTASGGLRAYTQDQILFDIERGFTPWAWGASRLSVYDPSIDLIRWIRYDAGVPLVFSDKPWFLADLDADGFVSSDEGCIIYNNIIKYVNGTLLNPHAWDGDLDLDGDVDGADLTLWIGYAAHAPLYSGWNGSCP